MSPRRATGQCAARAGARGAGADQRAMTPTKLLIGQILVVFAIVVLGVWASTQWAAVMLGYQARLGAPWFVMGGVPVYRPWALFAWWYHYDAYAPAVFDRAGLLAGASGFLGC